MIHHKNLKQHCKQETRRMIHDFLVDSRPDKHVNSSLDAVERILFTTAKHCLEIKNIIKRYTRVLTKNGLIKNVVLRDTN